MELTKIIESGATRIQDEPDATLRIKLIDVTTTNSLVAYGKLRIANDDSSLDGAFVRGADISVSLALGDNEVEKVFQGVIERVVEGQVLDIQVRGNGFKLKDKTVKRSLNKTNPSKILQAILSGAGVEYQIGELPDVRRHSYIMQSGTIAEELIRFINSFRLDIVPYFNREGVLIIKSPEENLIETDIVFEDAEYKKFENGILETILDVEIDIFNELKVDEVEYLVASHRFFLNERITKSYIALTEI